MATDLSVVVSYNTRDLLRDCLRSVAASSPVPPETFVVAQPPQPLASAPSVRVG